LRAFQSHQIFVQETAAKKEQFHARTGKKDENGTFNNKYAFQFQISHSRNNHQKDHNIFVSPKYRIKH
jgi:hypothetical protein